mmetsp:Transcript_23337/g.37505  ORF Transcript_23337/g.37505 Transcript_23337/m.37505 type:complete len:371 (-) Transcript_23337:361-1473(-)
MKAGVVIVLMLVSATSSQSTSLPYTRSQSHILTDVQLAGTRRTSHLRRFASEVNNKRKSTIKADAMHNVKPEPWQDINPSKKSYFVTLGVGSYIDYDKALQEHANTREDQKAYVKSKMGDGSLVAYGPLRGLIFPPTTPQDVGLWMIKADSLEEAKEIVKDSPYCGSNITPGCKVIQVNSASKETRDMEHWDQLEDIQQQIDEVRKDVEASRRVHQLLQTELECAHSELKAARQNYDQYNRQVNLHRFDWLSSGSIETFRRLQPVYEALEQLQAENKARSENEADIEAMYQTIARDFINVFEQEIDWSCSRVGDDNTPMAKWVTKVFGQQQQQQQPPQGGAPSSQGGRGPPGIHSEEAGAAASESSNSAF